MNTRIYTLGTLIGLLATVGCTQNGTTGRGRRAASDNASADPESSRRMITGSHVSQPTDRPAFDNVSANIPVGSAARRPDSLIPSEPTVGAGNQSTYRLREPSTGAGPEGEPTVRGVDPGSAPDATPKPTPRAARKPKPKATPTPTPN